MLKEVLVRCCRVCEVMLVVPTLQSVTAGRSRVDEKASGRRAVDRRLGGCHEISFFYDAEQVSEILRICSRVG